MKMMIGISLLLLLLNNSLQADDASTCSVTSHESSGEGSLRDLLQFSEEGQRCRDNIVFDRLPLPSRIVLEEPVRFAGQGVLITGSVLSSDREESLGIVIDGRGVSGCLITFCNPELNVLEHLTFYVSEDPRKVLCDAQGRSLLHPDSPAYDPRYRYIRVCRGPLANQCQETPIKIPMSLGKKSTDPRTRYSLPDPYLSFDLSLVDWILVKPVKKAKAESPQPPAPTQESSDTPAPPDHDAADEPDSGASTPLNPEPPENTPPLQEAPQAPVREPERHFSNAENTTSPSCQLMRDQS